MSTVCCYIPPKIFTPPRTLVQTRSSLKPVFCADSGARGYAIAFMECEY